MSRHLKSPTRNLQKSTFKDGTRSIDFILAYRDDSNLKKSNKRKVFESNLQKVGLELEEDEPVEELRVRFVKIHAPTDVCREYCEKLELRMPTKKLKKSMIAGSPSNVWYDTVRRCVSRKMDYDHQLFPSSILQYETAVYSRDREHIFDVNADSFFTSTIRATIVQFILDRTSFSPNDTNAYDFGIHQAYCAAYPLHEGDCDVRGTPRQVLSYGWASLRNLFRYQPLDHIQEYFGAEIGLYFTWLGFYTFMLLLPATLGSVCSLYKWSRSRDCLSWFVFHDFQILQYNHAEVGKTLIQPDSCHNVTDESFYMGKGIHEDALDNLREVVVPKPIFSDVICGPDRYILYNELRNNDTEYHCGYCEFGKIQDTCLVNTKQSIRLFEDCIDVLFTIFMCMWCASFLELWKQYYAEITRRWGVTEFDKREIVNPISNEIEPKVPFWTRRLPIKVLIIFCSIAIPICISFIGKEIAHRLSNQRYEQNGILQQVGVLSFIIETITFILRSMYAQLARYFKRLESQGRTQNEYDDSVARKFYLSYSAQNYWPHFDLVFLRAKPFIGWPKNIRISVLNIQLPDISSKQGDEICGLDGCLTNLRKRLTKIMISKQAINTIKQYTIPPIFCWLMRNKIKRATTPTSSQNESNAAHSLESKRWITDLKLIPFCPDEPMLPEYMEMVVQFGFIVLFARAFPLASLFALLNNVIEVRLDAKKMIAFYHRPAPRALVKHFNTAYEMLDLIGNLAVFTNSFIIAFLSDFIPKMVYLLKHSHDDTPNKPSGYLLFSLSYAKLLPDLDFDNDPHSSKDLWNKTISQTTQVAAWSRLDEEYTDFWICLAARLLFMVLFQNFVTLLVSLVRRYIRFRNVFVSQYDNRVEQPTFVI